MTEVAVCIVSFRDPALVVQCLTALARSTFTDFAVVICENGGAAARRALQDRLPAALPGGQPVTVVTQSDNLGYAGGVNACIAARRDAAAWWVLNPDTTPEPGALTALVTRLGRGDCDAVGGVLYHPGGRVQAYGGRWYPVLARATSIGLGASIDAPPDAARVERDMNYLLGACMLVSRAFVQTAGPMRDDYFLYAEEIEWCLRAQQQGLRLGFAPDARVCHGQGGTTGSAAATRQRPRLPIFLDERNKLHVVRDTTPAHLPIAAMSALILGAARFARRGAVRQWGDALAGWWAGIRNHRGAPEWIA